MIALLLHAESLCAADYHAHFQKAVEWVNEATGAELAISLEVRAVDKDELRASAGTGISVSPFAMFDKRKKLLVVNPNACRAGLFITVRTTKEMDDVLLVLLLHEVLHAYQATILDQHPNIGLPPRLLRALCEGHAITFSEAIAKAHGITTSITKNICPPDEMPFNLNSDTRRASLLRHFTYTLGTRCVAGRIGNVRHFDTLLDGTITYASFSEQHPQPVTQPTTAATAAATEISPPSQRALPIRHIEDSIKAGMAGYVIGTSPIDYLDAMAVLAPACFELPAVNHAFKSAVCIKARHDSSMLNIYVTSFADEAIAKDLFEQCHTYFAHGIPAKDGRVMPSREDRLTWQVQTQRVIIAARLRSGVIVFIEGADRDRDVIEKLLVLQEQDRLRQ